MASVSVFVSDAKPLTNVLAGQASEYKPWCYLQFQAGDDSVAVHFTNLQEMARFHALIGSEIQDYMERMTPEQADAAGIIDLSAAPVAKSILKE